VSPGRVLVVDDKDNIVKLLARILSPEYDVTTAEDGTRALALIAATEFDVIVSDIRMPGADGMTVLQETRRLHPETEVVLMTAFATVQDAVAAMKQGAYDYLQKPFEPDEALIVVRRAMERRQLRAQARDLQAALSGAHRFDNVVAESPADAQGARSRPPRGDERRDRADHRRERHRQGGGRARDPSRERTPAQALRPVNCGAMPEALFEAELFGYAKGAFTGAAPTTSGPVRGGRRRHLFLDEIGELPLAMQVKLLRALQERACGGSATGRARIDVRVIAATNIDLRAAVTAGGSATTCSTGSTCSRSRSRRCANAATTSRCSRRCSSSVTAATGQPEGFTAKRSPRCSRTTGRATSASSRTSSSARSR
jgi:DNA-binding NtrC family response regulator